MVSADQRRRRARQRWERQQARRAEQRARARARQRAVAAAALGAVAVVGIVVVGAWLAGSFGAETVPAAGGNTATETRPPAAGPAAPGSAGEPGTVSGTVSCSYPRSTGPQQRFVGTPPTEGVDASTAYDATIRLSVDTAASEESGGVLAARLAASKAPCTVGSFRYLAQQDFFDDTRCHRLTRSQTLKVLQCGDPSGTGAGGPGYTIPDENLRRSTYTAGTLAMANAGAPDTGGSQFFIVYETSQLPPQYTAFGTVVDGLDVVRRIADAGVADGSANPEDGPPARTVTIEDVTVEPLS